jgi:DNA uptake protein ComE-like DNA-binding protein
MKRLPRLVSKSNRRSPRRRGMVLILVLIVVSLLTLAAMTFSELMLAEREAAELAGKRVQARLLAESGVEATRLFLTQEEDLVIESGGWYDNEEFFRGMQLLDDPYDARYRGRFTVVAPNIEDGQVNGIRFGLEDESTKLNLNALPLIGAASAAAAGSGVSAGGESTESTDPAQQLLMSLPGMTESIADAILDWIDEDDEPREFGAEADYYSALDPAYAPRNGPLDTIEELLLVRDVTPWLLFGADANRNGYVDGAEPEPQMIGDVDNSDGSMTCGWAAYLTLNSKESNLNPEGEKKIDLNQENLEELYNALVEAFDEKWATFIIGYRQNGGTESDVNAVDAASAKPKLDEAGSNTLTTILDLIGQNAQVTLQDGQKELMRTPFPNEPMAMADYLPKLMDNVAVNAAETIPGRVNINQASRTVLLGIPGMTTDVADQIIGSRVPDLIEADPYKRYETWILSDGIVTLDEMKQMMPYVCARGSIFSAQIIGYFDGGGPSARIEIVLDATKKPPSVVFWRDMTNLGRGYPLEVLGIEAGTEW